MKNFRIGALVAVLILSLGFWTGPVRGQGATGNPGTPGVDGDNGKKGNDGVQPGDPNGGDGTSGTDGYLAAVKPARGLVVTVSLGSRPVPRLRPEIITVKTAQPERAAMVVAAAMADVAAGAATALLSDRQARLA